jgi:hypothetical protein
MREHAEFRRVKRILLLGIFRCTNKLASVNCEPRGSRGENLFQCEETQVRLSMPMKKMRDVSTKSVSEASAFAGHGEPRKSKGGSKG